MGLHQRSCPPAIVGFVISVVVDAIERVETIGWIAHVGIERRKTLTPTIANGDAASAVIGIAAVPRVEAPRLHVGPDSVDAGA